MTLAAAAAAAGAGMVIWILPWPRWPQWSRLFVVPVGLALVSLQGALSSPDFRVYGFLFLLLFGWIGVALPQWTALKALPLFAAAYLLPLVALGELSGLSLATAAYVGLACLLAGETLAWFSTRRTLGATAAVQDDSALEDIGRDLAGAADHRDFWPSIALRLSAAVDLPDCDLYRLIDDGSLECLASVHHGEPCPSYLGQHAAQDVWTVDSTTVHTKDVVFVATPDDPRLGAAERESMAEWGERAMLIVPLVARGAVIGLIEISETREDRTIVPEQISTVVSVCRLVAMTLHDQEVKREQEASARSLVSLLESSRAVAHSASVEEALADVARHAGEVLDVSASDAHEHDTESGALVARGAWERSPSGRDPLAEPLPLAGSPMIRVLESGRPLVERLSDPQLDAASRSDLERRGARGRLTVPLRSVDGPVGLLTLWTSEERAFSEQQMAIVSAHAGLAGGALHADKLRRHLLRAQGTDALTGLANRRELHEIIERERRAAERDGGRLSLVMLDLDGFTRLNSSHGHSTGDAVLRHVAERLTEQLRPADAVGRYGSDEFLLVLSATTAAEAGLLAESLRATLAETPYVTAAGDQLAIHASVGLAGYPDDAADAATLAAVAEANLRASKSLACTTVAADERTPQPHDAEDEPGYGARADAELPSREGEPPASERPDSALEPAADKAGAAPRRVWDAGVAVDQAEMRRRIEETRTRLKVKAFDAIIRGEAALLARDSDEATGVSKDHPSLDADLDGLVDVALSEDDV